MMHHFVIQCYRTATEYTPSSRRAWQALAMANYDLSTRLGVEEVQLGQKEARIKQVGLWVCFLFVYLIIFKSNLVIMTYLIW